MIEVGQELVRINSQKNAIEYSRDGRNWTRRCVSQACGTFMDLCLYGAYIYAVTSKGVYYSRDKGTNWGAKCLSKAYGEFLTIQTVGTELYAQTSRGLYASTDNGTNWRRK